jgi:hypothetical protein
MVCKPCFGTLFVGRISRPLRTFQHRVIGFALYERLMRQALWHNCAHIQPIS